MAAGDDIFVGQALDTNDETNSGDARYGGPTWDRTTQLGDLQGLLKVGGPDLLILDGLDTVGNRTVQQHCQDTIPHIDASVLNEPTGFPNRTDSVLSWEDVDPRTFRITPTGTSFDVWQQGVKYTIIAAEEIQIADTSGLHAIYYNAGALTIAINPSEDTFDNLILNTGLVALVYWNATDGAGYILGDERHGCIMSGRTHEWIHDEVGMVLSPAGGLAVSDYVIDTDDDPSLTFKVSDGEVYDEDLGHDIEDGVVANKYEQVLNATDAELPILYRDDIDGTWKEDAASTLPYKSLGAGRLAYNKDDLDGTFSQVEVTDGKWVSLTIIATNDWQYPIKAVQGQNEYTDKKTALEEATNEVLSWGTLPTPEFVVLYRFVMQTKNTYGGTKKAIIRDVTDFRGSGLSGASAVAATHDSLGNLELAGTGVTYGHIDDQAQTIAGIKTLASGTIIGTLTLANGSITDSSGGLSFGDENLTTTGWLRADDILLNDTNASHTLTLHWNEDEAGANRTLNMLVNGADRTVDLSGNLTVEATSTINSDLSTDANWATSGSVSSTGTDGLITGDTSNTGKVVIWDGSAHNITITAPGIAASYTLTLPVDDGNNLEVLQTNGAGVLAWVAIAGGGDVVGPAGATDNAIAVFDTATGKLLQDSVVLINAGAITGVTTLVASGAITADDLNLYDTNASHTLTLHWDEDEAGANRTLNLVMGGADRTLTLGGDIVLNAAVPGIGISDNELVAIDGADIANAEYAKFTANGLESKTFGEVLGDLSGQAAAPFDWNEQNLYDIGSIFMTEKAAADGDTAGDGQFWVETATPNLAKFTDDAGNDFNLVGRDLIAETILSGSETTVTFSSIPQTYDSLILEVVFRSDTAAEVTNPAVQFNGDTGNNYDYFLWFGNEGGGAEIGTRAATFIVVGQSEAANSRANCFGSVYMNILDYAGTSHEKRLHGKAGAIGDLSADTDIYLAQAMGHWRSTAAITSITVLEGSAGDLVSGCRLRLYGVK